MWLTLALTSIPVIYLTVDTWGWDFLNLHLFHHCEFRDTPYASMTCDPRGWPMN